jgi:hypothetical protein
MSLAGSSLALSTPRKQRLLNQFQEPALQSCLFL